MPRTGQCRQNPVESLGKTSPKRGAGAGKQATGHPPSSAALSGSSTAWAQTLKRRKRPRFQPKPTTSTSSPLSSVLSLSCLGGGDVARGGVLFVRRAGGMDEQGLGGFGGGGRAAVQGHGGRDAMLFLQQHHHQQQQQQRQQQQLEEAEEEEEARRQMFAGVAFPGALGYGHQAEEAGGLGDSDAGGSEPEPAPSRARGGSGSKRSRAAEVHNLSEKVGWRCGLSSVLCSDFAARVLKIVAWFGSQRRRSRINEKMKALQSLIPNSNKTDKASMLDEAIEYLKQLQLQMLSMRNGVYLNPPYLSGALEAAHASQMFAALGGGNITGSSSGAAMLPVNQSSGAQHQTFDPLNPPQNQQASLILPSVPDKTIPEPPFHLESSQPHLRPFQMPESSEFHRSSLTCIFVCKMMLRGDIMAKQQLTSAQERVNLPGNDMNTIRQESSIMNTENFDGCSRSKELSHDMVPKNTGHA
ncbi:hypothetical protein EJB05_46058, partial [Eragrostis curvula]